MSLNSHKAVAQVFESYQKARVTFVQSIAELAQSPKNIDALQKAGIMALLRPLLLDTVPSIQHNAAQALGKLANYTPDLALAVVNGDILPQLVYSLAEQDKFYKKAAALVLRSVAKHSGSLAQSVVDCGAVEALVTCLEEFDPSVKEAAAWALGYVARHTPGRSVMMRCVLMAELAQSVVDAGAVPLLVLCLQEPEPAVKRIAASALSDIGKHSPELAQAVVGKGAIEILAPLMTNKDAKLKRQVCSCLSQIAKHSLELSKMVVEAKIFPAAFDRLRDSDIFVRKNAACLMRELSKHAELAAMIITEGGAAAVVDYVSGCLSAPPDTASSSKESAGTPDTNTLPGVVTLGYLAGHAESLARVVIEAKGITPLLQSLKPSHEDVLRCAAAWALGHVGRHSPEHAKEVAENSGLSQLLNAYTQSDSSDELKKKSLGALKSIIEKCTMISALEPLIDSPPNVQQYVVHQFAKILPNANEVKARKDFVANGSLQKIQLIQADPGTKLRDYVLSVNAAYPQEIVMYYSPGYSQTLLNKLDDLSLTSNN